MIGPALESSARVAQQAARLERYQQLLLRADRWEPGDQLVAMCQTARQQIEAIQAQLGRKLVVSLIGPAGVGKSSLFNALAGLTGGDGSAVGVDRPTTRKAVVYAQDARDVDPLLQQAQRSQVAIKHGRYKRELAHLLLIDTPDLNTDEGLQEHRPLVESILSRSDLVLCVLTWQNVTDQPFAERIYPLIRNVPEGALFIVINQKDLIPPGPTFPWAHFERWWPDCPIAGVFYTATPAQGTTDLGGLGEKLASTSGSLAVDLRAARAERVGAFVRREIAASLKDRRALLQQGAEKLRETDRQTMSIALSGRQDQGGSADLDAYLYSQLCLRLIGPVGAVFGVWARLVLLGRQGRRLLSWLGRTDKGETAAPLELPAFAEDALQRYREQMNKVWVDQIAKPLIAAGFRHTLWTPVIEEEAKSAGRIHALWQAAADRAVSRAARDLCQLWLQALLNAPLLLLTGLVAYRMADEYLLSHSAAGQPLLLLLIVWGLSFTLQQFLVYRQTGERLLRTALERMISEASTRLTGPSVPIVAQIDSLLQLDQEVGEARPEMPSK